jgi:hypothetical protein
MLPEDPRKLKDGYDCYVATRLFELGPAKCVDVKQLVEWAEYAAGDRQSWQLEALGIAYLRADRLDDAIKTFLETNPAESPDSDIVRYGLAMAYHRRGDNDEAQKWLEQARPPLKTHQPPRPGEWANIGHPSRWLLTQLLSREADAMFGPSLSSSDGQSAAADK